MNILGQLEKLKMGDNYNLQGVVVSDGMGNGTSLTHLDISGTDLQFEVKRSVKTICNLQWVDLSYSKSTPKLTHLLRMFLRCSSNRLHHLALSGCRLSGPIPEFIGSLTSVKHLDLSDNQLSATIPTSIGQLIELEYLDLSSNSLQGTVSESFFANLARLDVLSASYNRIALRVGPDWNPPFQLTVLELSSWDLGPTFPEWLRSQHRLSYLKLAGIGIKDRVPTWFWDRSSQFQFVNLSSNDLSGEISGQIVSARLFDMSSNNFEGSLPSLTTNVAYLDLSNKSFSGSLSQFLCYEKDEPKELMWMSLGNNDFEGAIADCWTSWPRLAHVKLQNSNITGNMPASMASLRELESLVLSNNSLTGLVPGFLQNLTSLETLDLSRNLFSGSILQLLCSDSFEGKSLSILRLGNNRLSGDVPDCWRSWPMLERLELQGNELTGHLPGSIGSLSLLATMHLQRNNLMGELPLLLRNCTQLMLLDVGENKFGGSLPKWIGESLMRIIRLRSNNFEGIIPYELCALRRLQVLDIANNNISGHIPWCILNLSSMATESGDEEPVGLYDAMSDYIDPMGDRSTQWPIPGSGDTANLVSKGISREYDSNLRYMVSVDLSSNRLTGHIPGEIAYLAALISLNLSRNMLRGRIPENMGNLSSLESLDLSFNRLSGEIPQSMATMTKLSFLNLSYNNLTGTIPTSTQFSTFNQLSFLGNNLSVASTPLSNNKRSRNGSGLANHDHNGVEFNELYVSMVLGFVVGLGIVVAPLFYSRSWRLFYFQTMSNTFDRIWESVVLPVRVRFIRQV